MNGKSDYSAANLSDDLINEVKSFEDKLAQQAHKDVIIIAYEKERDYPN